MYQSLVGQGKLLLVSLGIFGTTPPCVDIGQRVHASCLMPGEEVLVLVQTNQLSPGLEFTANSIHYIGVVEQGRFVFISTSDPRFRTPEDLSMHTMFRQLPRGTAKARLITAWGWVCRLPSGRNCVFAFSKKVTPTSRPVFFYKSK